MAPVTSKNAKISRSKISRLHDFVQALEVDTLNFFYEIMDIIEIVDSRAEFAAVINHELGIGVERSRGIVVEVVG